MTLKTVDEENTCIFELVLLLQSSWSSVGNSLSAYSELEKVVTRVTRDPTA